MTCPHCGAGEVDVDRGAKGLDLCRKCGGLSRNGEKLRLVADAPAERTGD